jgi:selenocysteine lyase/cysteine desulfurase
VSAGHFYAVRCLEGMGIDPETGVLRISLVHYNNEEDVDRLLAALDEALSAA